MERIPLRPEVFTRTLHGLLVVGVLAGPLVPNRALLAQSPGSPSTPDAATIQTPTQVSAQELLQSPLPVSPGGAFLRSVLVPGWGHVAIGSYTRGGFYFALEAATAYVFLRTRQRLSEVRDRAVLRESVVRGQLIDSGVTVPEEIEAALAQDETLSGFRDLESSREGQQEDLVAWGIFLLFLSGADAYVSAHLGRFPEPIQVQVTPVASDRAEVGLRILLPNLP